MHDEKNPWLVKTTQVKYDNPWIRVDEHQVVNPAGNPGIYGVVHFKNIAVAVIPLDENNNTWIVGQYRFPHHRYEWEIPEGGCPEGSTPLETAKRELLEECGLLAENFEMILEMQLSNSGTDEVSYTFVARGITITESEPEETEVLQIKKIPFEELYQMVLRNEIRDALTVASVLKLKTML